MSCLDGLTNDQLFAREVRQTDVPLYGGYGLLYGVLKTNGQ